MVCCLKANGKILREFKDVVYVPFGTEYSIIIKNLNSVRARVTITVDGTDATEGASLIINANSESELTRFIKNGNLSSGNRFKFIERTTQIEEHRGVGATDGLIRVEFEFEQEKAPLAQWNHRDYWRDKYDGGYYQPEIVYYKGLAAPTGLSPLRSNGGAQFLNCATAQSISDTPTIGTTSFNDTGITVPGSVSDQKFTPVYGFASDGVKHAIVLKLLGENPDGVVIKQPITVEMKPTCVTCGTVNKLPAKFCSNCGTGLVIV